jgi:hypothetical protein
MASHARGTLLKLVIGISALILGSWGTLSAGACFPCIKIGPVTLTPVGPVPTAAVQPADNAVNKAVDTVRPVVKSAGDVATSIGSAAIAPQVHIFNVISGKENLGEAGKQIVQSQGAQVASVGKAISATNAAQNNIKVIAAESIAGDVGKTVVTIATGPDRLQSEFASTAAIQAGGLITGTLKPEDLIAEPLAAGIRAAENQFEPNSKPIPSDVKAKLAAFYPADVLDAARWTVGSVSISVPDLTNQFRKVFQDVENAVTVGHVTVFVRDPGNNYHWWAHELQHQVQYQQWGIDKFAYNYVTACHEVETGAETKAQQAVPISGTVSLGC